MKPACQKEVFFLVFIFFAGNVPYKLSSLEESISFLIDILCLKEVRVLFTENQRSTIILKCNIIGTILSKLES